MKALLLGNGDAPKPALLLLHARDAKLIIAADGAAGYALESGVWPHMAVGDFDSIDPAVLEKLREHGVKLETHPAEKDETDMELAARRAVMLGASRVVMLGCTGKRFDHALGSLHVLAFLRDAGVFAEMTDEFCTTRVVKDERIALLCAVGGEFSLIPMGDDVLIRELSGVKYPLSNYRLPQARTVGISNVFAAPTATLELSGRAALVYVG